MTFVSGTFQAFRALKTVHLGSIQKDIVANSIVMFDGQKVRFGDEEKHLPELAAAIKVGWLVPSTDTTSTYRPAPAGVAVHAAESRGSTRARVESHTVLAHDEKDLGTLSSVRPENALPTHTATRAGEVSRKPLPLMKEASQADEGRIVGRFTTPTNFGSIKVDGVTDTRVVSNLDNKAVPGWERVGSPLQGQLVGDTLSEILPDAPSSRVPAPGPAGEGASYQSADDRARGAVKFSAGSSTVGAVDDGVVIGKVGQKAAPEEVTEVQDAIQDAIQDEVPPEAIIAAKIEVIRQFVPGFEWDMKEHWRARVKKAVALSKNMPVFNAILSLETETVRRFVVTQVYGG